ncbi:MAG: dehydrogenase [Muribaculaceae bacterium]|nr:dehydrogenase [Muribaculaceae bacterium]
MTLRENSINILTALLLAFTASCSSGNSGAGDSSTITSDSLRRDSIAEAQREAALSPFPDTIFPSAQDVNVVIDRQDSTDGKLTTLKDLYSHAPGTLTFRKNEARDANFGGKIDSIPSSFNIDWEFKTREDYKPTKYGTWGGGTGWTGQPLYVEWPDSTLKRFREAGITSAAREIIVGSLCGDVCFINYETGQATRPAIYTGNPIKGTISIDPTFNGNLYVGQGVATEQFPVRALVIDLFKSEITHEFGPDPKAPRHWHAYDSSAIRVGQFLFRPGENGVLYKYIVSPGTLKLHSAARYHVQGLAPGIESSMAVCRNYGYTGDNRGNVICWNLNTLQPVWHYKLPDDIDATPVIEMEGETPFIYASCEVEHSGVTTAHFVKLNGLTGERVWLNETPAQRANVGEKHFDGGFYSTPLLGAGNCKDLIFTNVVHNLKGQNGSFIAIEKASGKIRYSIPLKHYAWSSPVGFMTPEGDQIIVTFDCSGNGYIINGREGKIISSQKIGANFESSPVVIGNTLVIGSRGSKVYRLSLR